MKRKRDKEQQDQSYLSLKELYYWLPTDLRTNILDPELWHFVWRQEFQPVLVDLAILGHYNRGENCRPLTKQFIPYANYILASSYSQTLRNRLIPTHSLTSLDEAVDHVDYLRRDAPSYEPPDEELHAYANLWIAMACTQVKTDILTLLSH
jgi:hypothetical protein